MISLTISNGKFSLQNTGSGRLVVACDGLCAAGVPPSVADQATHKRLLALKREQDIARPAYGDKSLPECGYSKVLRIPVVLPSGVMLWAQCEHLQGAVTWAHGKKTSPTY